MNSGIGFSVSWSTLIEQELNVGSEVVLPTMFGKLKFKVISIESGRACLENGDQVAFLKREGFNKWKYNNYSMSKNSLAKIKLVNNEKFYPQPMSNIGFTKTYK